MATANMMVARTILLVLFAACCNVHFILEQPADTLMHLHPRFVALAPTLVAYVREAGVGWHSLCFCSCVVFQSRIAPIASLARTVFGDVSKDGSVRRAT